MSVNHTTKQLEDIIGGENPTRFEDVKNLTTEEYFVGNQFSIDAFKSKYSLINKPDESYVQSVKRVCDYVASVEKTEKLKEYWSDRWFHEIFNDWWHPAGSIMQGAGSGRKISMANCNTVSLGVGLDGEEWDSLEAIIKNTAYTVAKSAAYRQGVGVDFSRLRPTGAVVQNSAKESTGSIHWMQFIDQIGYFVGQKGRIPALLFSLSCKHPDIEEFIKVKSDRTKIQNANISVQCNNDFYKAVKEDKDWELCFEIPETKAGQKVYVDVHSTTSECKKDDNGWYYLAHKDRKKEVIKKTVRAKQLMELIAKNMFLHAEPGIQNIDIAKKYSNSDYVYDPKDEYDSRIISTNACSEQYLSRESVCILSSINCGKFSIAPEKFDSELKIIAHSINRFLDNVNECEIKYETFATPHEKIAIEKLRRTGAGMTNISGWLFKSNVAYGSKESKELIGKFTQRYTYHLYASSISIGKEKGSFGLFNKEKLRQSPFIKRMEKMGLEFDTLRNVTVITLAPTGTLSLMFRDLVMSYGVEPPFGIYYWKRTRMKGKYNYYFNVPRIVREKFKEKGFEIPISSDTIEDSWQGTKGKAIAKYIDDNRSKIGLNFKSATEISPLDKLDLMANIMEWVDSSISVTYMLPEESTWKDVYNFIMASHEKEVKSISVFPDKKMYGIISFSPFKELAENLKKDGVAIHTQNFSKDELKELNISEESVVLKTSSAPKRQESLDAEIYSIVVNKEKYIVVVGLQNGTPYEIFGGKMNGLSLKIDHKHLSGKINKISRGKYALEFGDIYIDDFSQHFTPTEKVLFRSLSLMLRHGIPIVYVVEQLQKGNEDIFSLPSAIIRVLKKYVKDGQKVSGRVCPQCSGELIYNDGCVSCSSCNYSACS